MTSADLRESVMLGAPMFRGTPMTPTVDHIYILERAGHPALVGAELDSFDALSFLFVIAAPFEEVLIASKAETDDGGFEFSELQWEISVHRWSAHQSPMITLEEIAAAQRAARLAYRQIKASGFKTILRGVEVKSEDDVGNSHAPDSWPFIRRVLPGLCILTPIIFAAVCLMLRGCS